MNKWQRKAKALALLAKDQQGLPEGHLARQKLKQILEAHPEDVRRANQYEVHFSTATGRVRWSMSGDFVMSMAMEMARMMARDLDEAFMRGREPKEDL